MYCPPRLLDAEQMRFLFARELSASGYHIDDCRIIRAKHRLGRNYLVSYSLKLAHAETGEERNQLLSLVAFGKGESRERFKLAQQQPLVSTAIGKAVFHLLELEAVVWVFPNDRKLTGLPAVADSERLKNFLPEVIAKSFGEEWKIAAMNSEVVSYAAERACTVRATLELSNSRTGEVLSPTLFGKTYCPGEGEAVWQAMKRLWRQGRLLIPQPLCFQPEIKTLWQQGLTGNTLDAFDAESEELRGWLRKAGAAVAELHRLKLPGLTLRNAVNPLSKLAEAENLLARAVPACQSNLYSLVRRLREAAGKIEPLPAAILHGDLHLKNFLATGGNVALIDWDNVCQGDQLQEVGSFIASLHYCELLKEPAAQPPEQLIHSFVAAYRANVDWEFSASALDWHTAAALIYERAYRHVIRLNADASVVVESLIALADRLSEKL